MVSLRLIDGFLLVLLVIDGPWLFFLFGLITSEIIMDAEAVNKFWGTLEHLQSLSWPDYQAAIMECNKKKRKWPLFENIQLNANQRRLLEQDVSKMFVFSEEVLKIMPDDMMIIKNSCRQLITLANQFIIGATLVTLLTGKIIMSWESYNIQGIAQMMLLHMASMTYHDQFYISDTTRDEICTRMNIEKDRIETLQNPMCSQHYSLDDLESVRDLVLTFLFGFLDDLSTPTRQHKDIMTHLLGTIGVKTLDEQGLLECLSDSKSSDFAYTRFSTSTFKAEVDTISKNKTAMDQMGEIQVSNKGIGQFQTRDVLQALKLDNWNQTVWTIYKSKSNSEYLPTKKRKQESEPTTGTRSTAKRTKFEVTINQSQTELEAKNTISTLFENFKKQMLALTNDIVPNGLPNRQQFIAKMIKDNTKKFGDIEGSLNFWFNSGSLEQYLQEESNKIQIEIQANLEKYQQYLQQQSEQQQLAQQQLAQQQLAQQQLAQQQLEQQQLEQQQSEQQQSEQQQLAQQQLAQQQSEQQQTGTNDSQQDTEMSDRQLEYINNELNVQKDPKNDFYSNNKEVFTQMSHYHTLIQSLNQDQTNKETGLQMIELHNTLLKNYFDDFKTFLEQYVVVLNTMKAYCDSKKYDLEFKQVNEASIEYQMNRFQALVLKS
jgi:hypothetical protein